MHVHGKSSFIMPNSVCVGVGQSTLFSRLNERLLILCAIINETMCTSSLRTALMLILNFVTQHNIFLSYPLPCQFARPAQYLTNFGDGASCLFLWGDWPILKFPHCLSPLNLYVRSSLLPSELIRYRRWLVVFDFKLPRLSL